MSRQIPFNVSARTARLIGRENVGSAQAAIIELIKNGYDADAETVQLTFDGSVLLIADTGDGMSESVIEKYWMTIGTDNKDIAPLTKNGRVKSGAKGIGRFALDKLGDTVEMLTKTSDSDNAFKWTMDWRMFDEKGVSVNQINADLQAVTDTKFLEAQKQLGLEATGKGTILKIGALRDIWDKDELDSLYGALESLVPTIENDAFTLTMISRQHPADYGVVQPLMASDFDYRIESHYSSEHRAVQIKMFRNELSIDKLKTAYRGVFSQKHMSSDNFQLQAFEKSYIEKTVDVGDLIGGGIEKEILDSIGDFDFDFIFAKNQVSPEDKKVYPYKTIDYGSRAEWLKQFSGVKIYRDNFRVRPYGENGDDWLRLGERQARSPQGPGQRIGAYRIRPNQIAGAVRISRMDSTGLQDKSSREGIHEDASFRLLKNIVVAIINQFEMDRNIVQYSIRQEFLKINRTEGSKQEGEKALKSVNEGKDGPSESKANASALANYVEVLKDENEDQREEIRIMRSLASSGLVTAAAAHELWGYRNQLETRASSLRSVLEDHIPEKSMSNVDMIYNPYIHIQNIEETDRHIAGWLNYALKPIRKDRRSAQKVYIDTYLNSLHESWDYMLNAKHVSLDIENIPKNIAIKMYPIDLDSIFNNLIINSIDSFWQSTKNMDRKISVSAHRSGKNVIIDYQDTGDGLADEFKNDPEQIFLPHVTSKRNTKTGESTGMGMGMYIVKMIVDECKGQIEINNTGTGFGLSISFRAVK
ncbi:MAG: ATP-binding protein [Acidobacteriota bacterium]